MSKQTKANIDLDNMNTKALMNLSEKLSVRIREQQEQEKADVKEAIQKMASDSGFTVQELFGFTRKGGVRAMVKFSNPDDRSETWTGRGRQPRWLADKISAGAKLEDFRVSK